ncbi:MAG: cation:proton antiporter [Hydrogenophilaceae bacterium]|jgi:glutathione-regulated potassium-efflux system protein KefB|nr:cation:proton antiporter [Hydrogenophilaceae bacterium]
MSVAVEAAVGHGGEGLALAPTVALLAAAVIAVPLFRRVGLGSVLGYLAAGLAIGPFGMGLFTDAEAILHVAELGVVMFLFVIGLEMQPLRLWSLRSEIFGLGATQVAACGLLLTGVAMLMGFSAPVAFVAAFGFVLTSTAVVMQILDERAETNLPTGQRAVSVLLLEDLAIVPLLAIVAFMAPAGASVTWSERLIEIGIAVGAIVGIVVAGRYLLNPLFRVLAAARAREVMTAAALLVVLGAAYVMQLSGLSMAMGAFLAGVLLSESVFRHQLEADIEPFRGILLGLFFMGVGMALQLDVVAAHWPLIALLVLAFMVVKSLAVYGIARAFKADHGEALTRAAMFAQGGEFAFVLYSGAADVGVIDAQTRAQLTAAVIISMALTPLLVLLLRAIAPKAEENMDGVERVQEGLTGSALIIGFGRFGQVVSQPLLARGVEVAIIDNDTEMIRAAADFGFKVYYGDGTRADILHAAGAGRARIILVCVDKGEQAVRIVKLIKEEFPLANVFARAFDRGTTIELVHAGVDYQIRETLRSANEMGAAALNFLGVQEEEVQEIADDLKRRDEERLSLQLTGDIYSGRQLLLGNIPRAEEERVGD